MNKFRLIRTSSIPVSLNVLLKGQLKFLNTHFEVVGVSAYDENLEEVANREEVRVASVSMQRRISPFKDLASLFKLISVFLREKPQIVHSITPKAGLLSMLAAKFVRIPIRMHTFTGLIFPSHTGAMQKLLIKMDQLLCWAATNVYPEGNGVRNDLISYKITSKPLNVLANGNVNGIDLDYFNPEKVSGLDKEELKNDLKILSGDFVFIFIGRIVGDKGINELIQAFIQLKAERETAGQKVKLLLVGSPESDLDPILFKTQKEINENPNIIAVGFQNDVRPYLSISDAFVFPSYREGFPNVVMQAGAMGLPSIVTDINGCNEIVIHNKNGVIIPPKDKKELLEAMEYFLNHRKEIGRMAQNARPLIAGRYAQQMVWDALLEEYNRLLEEKKLK